MANRHFSRIQAIQSLYEWDFRPEVNTKEVLKRNIEQSQAHDVDIEFVHKIIDGVQKNIKEIDKTIEKSAPEWPLEQIAIIDKTVLRVAIFELLYSDEVPPKVAIDEAVELAKSFGGDNSSKFVNGVLGTVYRQSDKYEKEPGDKPAKPIAEEKPADDKNVPLEDIPEIPKNPKDDQPKNESAIKDE